MLMEPVIPRPERLRVRVRGAVQGVGFRPHVYRLARRLDLAGFVLNDGDGVLVEVEGGGVRTFLAALVDEAPPLARVDSVDSMVIATRGDAGFAIADSRGGAATTRLAADAATCAACRVELFDPASRFHHYPFVTCTQCGPRFTMAAALPYDRATTAMASFPMCDACTRDYHDPDSRRFHAESIACPACGPQLSHAIADIAEVLRGGGIVALKGIGGFQLLCDAGNADSIARLRAAKRRPARPFAIMLANAASIPLFAEASPAECRLAAGTAAPIVLMRSRGGLPAAIAPGLDRIGVMLAHAPVHHLLFAALAGPAFSAEGPVQVSLVATSGNAGGEPIAIDDGAALAGIADLVVSHDRAILHRADDSVMQVIDGAPAFLRRARGFVPEPVALAEDGPDVIAFGGHLKSTVTVTRGREAFVSQHIGDLDDAATLRFLRDTAARLSDLLGVTPQLAACDLHPDYVSTRAAEASGLPVRRVQHHAAHLAAVAAEHRLTGAVLGAALDGHGLGDDGTSWGGELMLLESASHRRLGNLKALPLPGGDRATREPWRMALAACAELGLAGSPAAQRIAARPGGPAVLALAQRRDGARTTSLGRLFDAAAGLLGVCDVQSFEGEAAMRLEALAAGPLVLEDGFRVADGILDFSPLLVALMDVDAATGARLLHGTLARGIASWLAAAALLHGQQRFVLGGGCLMNRLLGEAIAANLRQAGITPLLAHAVPPNDGGLSLGQAVIARRHGATIAGEN